MKFTIRIFLLLLAANSCFAEVVHDFDFINLKDRITDNSIAFTRASAALNRDGTEAASGVARMDAIPLATPLESTLIEGKAVLACDDRYVYAEEGSRLYRSIDGQQWSLIYTFPAAINSGFITEENTLLVSLGTASGENAGTVWRMNAGGTFDKVIDHDQLAPLASVAIWGWTKVAGQVYITEYRTSMTDNNARRVFQSADDGRTWKRIYGPEQSSTEGSVSGRHAHRVVGTIVNGKIRIYTSHGDGSSKAMYYLEEGASGWTRTEVLLTTIFQPTSGLWIPERNEILWGTDGSSACGIYAMDLNNHTFIQRLYLQHPRTDSNFYDVAYNFFSGHRLFGQYVFMATQATASSAELYKHHGIYVSSDTIHWQRVGTLPTLGLVQSTNCIGAGPDGALWVRATISAYTKQSYKFAIPQATTAIKGVLIERAGNQSYNNIPIASAGTLQTPYTPSAGDPWVASDMWNGASADIRWYGTADKEIYLSLHGDGLEVIPDLLNGDQAYVSFWIKGKIGDGSGNHRGTSKRGTLRIYARTLTSTAAQQTSIYGYTWMDEITTQWRRVVLPVVNTAGDITGGIARMGVLIYTQANAAPEDQQFDILIDGITFEKAICPAEYHPQSSPRAAEILSYTPTTFPVIFTDLFWVAFRFGEWNMAARQSGDGLSYIYLRSYAEDTANFIALVYDVYDKKFKLIDETAGSQSVIAASSEVYLTADEVVSAAISCNGTSVAAVIWTGAGKQTISGAISGHALSTMYWGSHPDGSQGGSLVFLRNKLYNEILHHDVISEQLQYPTAQIITTSTGDVIIKRPSSRGLFNGGLFNP